VVSTLPPAPQFQGAEVPQALTDAFFPPSSSGLGEDITAAASSSADAFNASFAHDDNAFRTGVFPDSFLSAAATHPPQLSDLFSSSFSATNAFATSDVNALNSFSAAAASDSPSALSISPAPQPADNSAPLSAQCDEELSSGGDSAALIPLPPASVPTPPVLPSWDSGLYEDGPHLNISTWGSDAEIGEIVSPKGQVAEVRIDTLVMLQTYPPPFALLTTPTPPLLSQFTSLEDSRSDTPFDGPLPAPPPSLSGQAASPVETFNAQIEKVHSILPHHAAPPPFHTHDCCYFIHDSCHSLIITKLHC
jgi:hypothetical protein